jgi:exonuclease SbcD
VEWRKLAGIRTFIDRFLSLEGEDDRANLRDRIFGVMPSQEQLEGAIFRLTLEYPREWEELIDDGALRQYAAGTFEFHLMKRPQIKVRIRIRRSAIDLPLKSWSCTALRTCQTRRCKS